MSENTPQRGDRPENRRPREIIELLIKLVMILLSVVNLLRER